MGDLVWKGDSGHVNVRIDDGVAILTIDRPEKLNALTVEMLKDIGRGIESHGDGSKADALVLTGEGRAFSAGDDLKATEDLDDAGFEELISSFQALTLAVLRTKVPVVAALNGLVVGGAAEWVLSCDARVGGPETYFLFPENSVGLTISNASTYLLPRFLGGRALPAVLSGERIRSDEASRLGLIDYLVDDSTAVLPKAVELARAWSRPGLATDLHLRMLRPPLDEIEKAIARENGFASEGWNRNLAREAIGRFYSNRNDRRG